MFLSIKADTLGIHLILDDPQGGVVLSTITWDEIKKYLT